MQVILLERIRNLGDLGDEVHVKAGFGRNFLVPQGKAVPADAENRKMFEARRAELEKHAADQLADARHRADDIEGATITIPARAGEEGKLYGSVGPREIADAFASQAFPLNKSEVLMPLGPIRETGEYEVDLQFHSDVVATVHVVIIPE